MCRPAVRWFLFIIVIAMQACRPLEEQPNTVTMAAENPTFRPDLTGFWVATSKYRCSGQADQDSVEAVQIKPLDDSPGLFSIATIAKHGQSDFNLQLKTTDATGRYLLLTGPSKEYEIQLAEDGNHFSASGSNLDTTCSFSLQMSRFSGPEICDVLPPREERDLLAAIQESTASDPDLGALHHFWESHNAKWPSAASLSPGRYQWQADSWQSVSADEDVVLELPDGILRWRDVNDGWGSYQASLTQTTFPSWTVRYTGPRGLDNYSSSIEFGAWSFWDSVCDANCSGFETITMTAPFGEYDVSREWYTPAFLLGDMTLHGAETFQVKTILKDSHYGYDLRYGEQTTSLTSAHIAAYCPDVIYDALSLFPNTGELLLDKFPFRRNFDPQK